MKPAACQSALRNPLNGILSTQAHVRVLRELYRHGGEMAAAKIAVQARLSPYGARLALAELVLARIVEDMGSGRSILYRINAHHPLAAAIEGMFQAERALAQSIPDAIAVAVNDRETLAAWIYGSFARGEDQIGSDLDIAIVIHDKSFADLPRIRQRLEQCGDRLLFSPALVCLDRCDVERLSRSHDPWWQNLVAEAMVVKGAPPEVLARRQEAGA